VNPNYINNSVKANHVGYLPQSPNGVILRKGLQRKARPLSFLERGRAQKDLKEYGIQSISQLPSLPDQQLPAMLLPNILSIPIHQ